MKSLLQEASSIMKAIEKAWQGAGKPEEFTIKIFEKEKRNFLGFVKKQAIVSILYEPERMGVSSQAKKGPQASQRPPVSSYKERGRPSTGGGRRETSSEGRFEPVQDTGFDGKQHAGVKSAREVTHAQVSGQMLVWESPLIMDMSRWLKDLVDILGMQVPFKVDSMGGLLKIQFEKPLVAEIDYERMLFASFSHLLMQVLKRKNKNKFRGLRLAISSIR